MCVNGWLLNAAGFAFRCGCWRAHQARVAELDVPAQPVALIESVPEGQ